MNMLHLVIKYLIPCLWFILLLWPVISLLTMAQDITEQPAEEKLDLQLTRTRTASSLNTDHGHGTVTRIATNLQQQASVQEEPETDYGVLHPVNPHFSPHEWAKRTFRSFDAVEIEAHRRGVLFENLSVFGSGSSVQLQQTVLPTLMLPFFENCGQIKSSTTREKNNTEQV